MELSDREKQNQRRNYLKLWLLERTNGHFMFRIEKIRRMFGVKGKAESQKVALELRKLIEELDNRTTAEINKLFGERRVLFKELRKLNLPVEKTAKTFESIFPDLPNVRFKKEMDSLMEDFNFGKEWKIPLLLYVVSDKIYPPHEKMDKDAPKASVVKDWIIFDRVVRLKGHKSALRGYTKQEIDDLGDDLPYRDYTNIADEMLGSPGKELPTEKEDKKRANLIAQRYKRFLKCFVSVPEDLFQEVTNMTK